MHQQLIGDSLIKTFYNAVGLKLLVYQIGAGSFTWTTGQDAAGNPQIYFTALPMTFNSGPALLLVFAI